jgi:hypothetical protein
MHTIIHLWIKEKSTESVLLSVIVCFFMDKGFQYSLFQFKFYRLFVTGPVTGYNLIGMTK